MKLFGFMVAYNEEEFIEYSIRSVISHLDRLIIIEGAWAECYQVNGHLRSIDKTISIIHGLQREFPNKISLTFENANSQLEQRNKYFRYGHGDEHYMLLIDADEVWSDDQIITLKTFLNTAYTNNLNHAYFTVDSWVFINDFKTYSKVRYPRVWHIDPVNNYTFIEPNRILVNNTDFLVKQDLDLHYFHYSYCHKPQRFIEKKRERTKLHGFFPWNLDEENRIVRADANIEVFNGKHPAIIKTHPMYKE